ncbi:hypothetical protein GXW82_33180 [Streptacidiphilus sp. 4-A2]|nr:hypothetical protein [Streptacidiphilus sp. 4-A2]
MSSSPDPAIEDPAASPDNKIMILDESPVTVVVLWLKEKTREEDRATAPTSRTGRNDRAELGVWPGRPAT